MIYERIANVQQAVGSVLKTTEGYGYKYATLSDVWELVKQAMKDNHLGWTAYNTPTLEKADGMTTIYNEYTVALFETDYPATGDDGEYHYPPCTTKTETIHTTYMFEATGAQAVGSYETYYRRYALLSLLGLTTIADDDGTTPTPTPTIQAFN